MILIKSIFLLISQLIKVSTYLNHHHQNHVNFPQLKKSATNLSLKISFCCSSVYKLFSQFSPILLQSSQFSNFFRQQISSGFLHAILKGQHQTEEFRLKLYVICDIMLAFIFLLFILFGALHAIVITEIVVVVNLKIVISLKLK